MKASRRLGRLVQDVAARMRRRTAPTPSTARWVVLDVESTGLDPARDHLLAIAAVALRMDRARPEIDLADSFDAVLQHEMRHTDKANILLHGIGVGAMRAGLVPADVLRHFDQWAGDAPRLGFHVAFDRALIERAEREALGRVQPALWLDIEPLAAITHPKAQPAQAAQAAKVGALDEWLLHFGIPCLQRHQAMADALATAELLLRLWPRLQRECRGGDARALARLAAARRWL